ncbi:MAG TPA: hypothetical protein VMS17_12500 [Gemmataceae bacterium]|nr:hypothetical protein [Gemmataceae bacterium]
MSASAFLRSVVVLFLLALLGGPLRADEPKGGPPELKGLKFRSIGPAAGGRVDRACGVPGDPHVFYAAVSAGGVWKSTDGGLHWDPIFDDQPVSTIGSIAVAPSDPNILYVGSGEANIRGNVEVGDGIYKSVDAGKTWKHVWKQEGQIGTIIVHPQNPDIAYAAVLGHAFGPNEERGVYRTTDGGKTWQQVLKKDKDTGASDVCFDPSSPKVLFAGMWQTRRRPWELTSGGPGSGLYMSHDGGDTWTQLVPPPKPDSPEAGNDAPAGKKYCEGLPEGIWGKVCVAVAPSDGRRVYAMIEADDGGLFRSDDGGDSWDHVSDNHGLRQRAWYFSTLTVHPKNPDVVWFPEVPLLKTIDGGKTLKRVEGAHHGDHHDIWFDPKDPNRIIDSNDGGLDISTNGGETWYAPPLPISQFYHVAADNRTPYYVSGCMQDIGSAEGPSNSLKGPGIRLSDWFDVGGGEAGFTIPDPADPNIVYAGEYGGFISRYDHRTRQAKNVSIYPYDTSGFGGEDLRYRFQWTAPILISPHDPKVIYHGANVLFQSSDGGETWKPISGDLTRNDKNKEKWSGGPITGDNTGAEIYCTIFALAESPKQKGLLWAGSDDGMVHVTHDGGKNWTDVTPNIKGLPEWGTVGCIEASPFDADTAYLVVDAHRLDDMKPYLWKTGDGGKTWASLSAKLPQDTYLRAVREDPKKKGMLYLATEHGIQLSMDDGATWKELKLNLPTVAVSDLVVKDDDLVVGTSGRSLWVFDDLTPVREMVPAVESKDVHLFSARPAYRYRYSSSLDQPEPAGTFGNPPEGAILHYFLKKPAKKVTLEILDDKGNLVRKLSSKKEDEKDDDMGDEGEYSADKKEKKNLPIESGLHRVVWDLRYEGAEVLKKAKEDGGDVKTGPLVNPGTYTLKLTADGQTETTTLEVRLSPREAAEQTRNVTDGVPGAPVPPQLDAELKLALEIRDDITKLTRTVNQLRAVKKQLEDRDELLKDDDKAEDLVKASKELATKIDALDEKFQNPKAKVSYDILEQKGGAQLYSQLAFLFEAAKGADGAPPQGLRDEYADEKKKLEQYEQEWKSLTEHELDKLNEEAKKGGYPIVIVPVEKKEKEEKEKP